MAFKGDLKNISLFDVLQTLHQNRQTGVLVVHRDGVTKKVYIDTDGVRVFFTRSRRPLRLGEIFIRRGRITPQDVEILLLQQKQAYRPMGELLVESGKIGQEEIDAILQYHAEDEIYGIFAWEHGTFAFYDGQSSTEGSNTPLSAVLLDPAGLCLEAARRLDEMERCRQVVPDDDCYLIQVEGTELDRENADERICATYDALVHPGSLNDLRDLVGLSLYDILGGVVKLIETNLVRMLGPAELVEAGQQAQAASDHERAAQMLEKAHYLVPDDRGILEQCVEAVRQLDDKQQLSTHMATLGKLSMLAGDNAEAIDQLEQALRQDSDNHETLATLRNVFAQLGDTERTAEISLKMARSFTEQGDFDKAIEACREGQELSPDNVPLRYHVAKLLARTDRIDEAKDELNALVRTAEPSDTAVRSRRTHELLTSCYRLLLKIDPEDEAALRGMRSLNRQRVTSLRRNKWVVRGSIAAALLAVVGVVGLSTSGPGPEEMLAAVKNAYESRDVRSLRSRVDELLDEYPDSDEAQRALGFLSEMEKRRRANDATLLKRQKAIRAQFQETWDDTRTALNDRPYLEGLALVEPFLHRLNQKNMVFLRAAMKANFEYEFSAFLDRVLKQFGTDRQQLALGEYQLRKSTQSVTSLRKLEAALARIRARNWTSLVPRMQDALDRIANTPQAGKAKDSVEAFRKMIGDTHASFDSLDTLYFTVRRKRMRLDITEAVATARDQRLDLLRHCEFAKARERYATAFALADAVTDEEPREHFRELIKWLESTNMREDMHARREEIDQVVATLAEVERLRRAKHTAAAYRLFRPLIVKYPVIQFERKYTAPYLVRSTPTNAEVWINGKRVGRTPVDIELDIAKRAHIVVKRAGFASASTKLMPTDAGLSGELELNLTKKTTWQRSLHGRVEAAPRIAKIGAKYLVLVATSNADLIALDLKSGVTQWAAETKLLDRILAPPVVDNRYAYVITVGGLLHRVRLRDGAILKKKLQLPGQVKYGAAYDGKTLYVATQNRRLIAIRGGTVVYNKPMRFAPTTRLAYSRGRLFVGTAEGVILSFHAATGKRANEMRTRGVSSFLGGITVHKGLVVAGAEDGALYAFDAASGKHSWRYTTSGPVTAPPISGKFIFLPARDGYIHALNARGKPMIRYETDGSSEHAPAVANGFLYTVSGDKVTAFDTNEETSWWQFTFDSNDGGPEHILTGGDHIVVITTKSQIVAFPQDAR